MRVVALGGSDGHEQRSPDRLLDSDGNDDELVLIHEAASRVRVADLQAAADQTEPHVDLVVGAWTFTDDEHGVVERRGVFSPERLRWANTVGPAVLVAPRIVRQAGWGTDGHLTLQDLLLRLSELDPSEIVVESTATVFADVDDVSRLGDDISGAVNRHLARVGCRADVRPAPGPEPAVIVDRIVPDDLTVSVVIPATGWPTEDHDQPGGLVVNLLDSLLSTTDFDRDRLDVVLVVGPEAAADLTDVVNERYEHEPVRFVSTSEPFAHSHRTNLGVLAAASDVVVLLNDDTEVSSPGWLGQIATAATEPGVGLVGPLMRFPDGSVQSAGHAHPHTNVGEPMAQIAPSQEASIRRGRDVAGVTFACAAVMRDRYVRAGGLSPRIHNAFNDVDLAMKLERLGYRHVSLGHVELVHRGTATRVPGFQGFESAVLYQRWGSAMASEHLHHTDRVLEAIGT